MVDIRNNHSASQSNEAASQRIDKWLWYARFFKTRSLATKFVASGHLRLTRDDKNARIEKPGFTIKPGDTLSFMIGQQVKIIHILHIGHRRGPAPEAQALYEDQSPPPPAKPDKIKTGLPTREPGSGRPTKKERRAIDSLKMRE